jgi:AraC-like DNA-binding protein
MKHANGKIIDVGSIWFGGSSVGSTLYPPESTLGPRIQAYVQLVFLHFGHVDIQIDSVSHRLKANNVQLLLPGHEEYFEFDSEQETLHSYVHIPPAVLPIEVQERLAHLPRSIALSRPMENLIHSAITSHGAMLSTRDKILETLAMQMLWQYIGEAEALGGGQEGDEHQRIPRAQLFIHDHLADKLDLAMIAKSVHLSKPQLTRIFKKELGMTPMAYVWQRRIAAAVEMLKHSGLSIQLITERCGFESRYHFSRRIKETTKMSPRELRHSYWTSEHIKLAITRNDLSAKVVGID